jgi:predicted membrane-bound mannosyltransferase/DNA-binding beta-propeller fold protein YncE
MSELGQPENNSLEEEWLNQPLVNNWKLDLEKTIYLIIIAISLITRLWGIGDRVVSHDESLHTQYSYQYFNGDGYEHTPLMHGPSLFHVTALSFWLFGDNDTSARIPLAIIGTILVVLPYFLRKWIGKAGAIAASVLLLISPYMTYYSRYIRHDIIVITAAAIVFIAIQYYRKERKDKYIWWFAIGLALMFTTMETSYIYVAIFGSFLVLSLLAKVVTSDWIRAKVSDLKIPIILVALAIALLAGGFAGQYLGPRVLSDSGAGTEEATEAGFAADPNQDLVSQTGEEDTSALDTISRWIQFAGIIVLAAGLFMTAYKSRPFIDEYADFDLIVLFTTLTLPTATAFLIILAGGEPLSYTLKTCQIAGQESMSGLQLFFARITDPVCRAAFTSSPVVLSGVLLVVTLIVSVLVGLWWNLKRWIIAALIFHGIFLILFTSFFTNPSGWASGMIGSLGYWLEQQEVQRANQPGYFYFIVLPLYEFLPLLLTFLGTHLWAKKKKIHKIIDYWILFGLLALLIYSLTNYFVNRQSIDSESQILPGLLAAGTVLVAGIIYWVLVRHRQVLEFYEVESIHRDILKVDDLFGFIPYLIWWFLVSWLIYSLAGEKMAWLSLHFIFPMALLGGWYINELLITADLSELKTRRFGLLLGLTILTAIAIGLALTPIILGKVRIGDQAIGSLTGLGRFIGALVIAVILIYFLRQVGKRVKSGTRRRAWIFAIIILLGLLTIRFSYMASFPNADFVTEYLVYAHGAPATKSEVLSQLEDLSMRIEGDKGVKVAFDNDSSWPFTWYLREYPNRQYFGENPDRSITDAPVIIVGSQNWSKVEPLLGDDYEETTYTFLWWPMEEYRNISWNSVLGDPNAEPEFRKGVGNPDVRHALWDIFFYRDYQKYGEVFGGNYNTGEWPLRHDLRMYIQKQSLASIWDHGLEAVAYEPPVDPYAENQLSMQPVMVIGGPGSSDGELLQPRNVAISPEGLIAVADSGNHRIQVFDNEGQFLRGWGSFGIEPGQFNEPWGVAMDDSHIYVADTWNHRVQVFTHEGELVQVIGQSGSPAQGENGGGLFFGPRDIALLADGRILVTDTGNHRIQIFDEAGNFIQAFGSQGAFPGQFSEPVGIAASADGSLVVADTWNGRIQSFTGDFQPGSEFAVDAWYGESINNKPYLATDKIGRVYVTDPEGYQVLIFDSGGQYLARFGQYSTGLDGFALPNGIATDDEGNLYVADAGNGRVLKFSAYFSDAPLERSNN